MSTNHETPATAQVGDGVFEAPELKAIGDVTAVVRGFFGTGWDGPYGMTEPEFEFEADATRD